jgi:predicted O-linked N-acetylglucosamine transferase (SPINDLY family)
VLIDLSGHTGYNRLGVFALRAAPVQAHYLGYFATTGLTEMDYWLGDSIVLQESEDTHYSETIWRLPRVWVSYHGQDDAPLPNWSPKDNGTLLLGSFNNIKKMTPATLALWAKLLHALPEARLMLKTKGLADLANRKRIEDDMNALGIGVDRIELIGKTDHWASHMALYDRLDIALDPIGGVGGGTTTCDALWMGVPVVTLAGRQMIHRMTASMLDSIGHSEWIAETEDDYVAKVVALARDVEQRRSLRHGQRERMRNSPLCDAAGLAHSLEDAYEAMFDSWFQAKSGARNIDNAATDTGNQSC